MKNREIIICLIAATLGIITIASWNSETEALERADKFKEQSEARIRKHIEDMAKSAKEIADIKNAASAAEQRIVAEMAMAKADSNKTLAHSNAELTKAKDDVAKAKADLAKMKSEVAEAKNETTKAEIKALEFEKAKKYAAEQINELSSELAQLREDSSIKEAIVNQRKAGADLEAASTALREANAKNQAAQLRIAELEAELLRLREESKSENKSRRR